MKKSQFKLPFKHYVNRYNAQDVCVFHRGTDDLTKALQWYAQECQNGQNGDQITLWKGRARTKPFAEKVIHHRGAHDWKACGCQACVLMVL